MSDYADLPELWFEVESLSTRELVFWTDTLEKAQSWAKDTSEGDKESGVYLVTEEAAGMTTRLELWFDGVQYRP